MFLSQKTFTTVIASTPLISIDLIVENFQGQVLLGLRNNKPAQGFWFVPGGRVLKNETLDNAFQRLCKEELGAELTRQQSEYIGSFEHFYEDCVFDDNISTHYVVLAYKLTVDVEITTLPQKQHNKFQWFDIANIESDKQVHLHTKWYFNQI